MLLWPKLKCRRCWLTLGRPKCHKCCTALSEQREREKKELCSADGPRLKHQTYILFIGVKLLFFFPPARTTTSNSIRSTHSGTRGPSWTGTQLRVGMAAACDIDWFLLFPLRQRGEPNQLCHNETKFIFISLKPRAKALDWNPRCWVLIQL